MLQGIVNMQHLMNFNDFFLEDLPPTVCSGKPPEYQALVLELLAKLNMFYSELVQVY